MRLYKHNTYTDVIEFVGVGHGDLMFRYVGWEFKEAFFALDKPTLKRYYTKLPKRKREPIILSPVSSKSTNNF